jgi:hypothetical protein
VPPDGNRPSAFVSSTTWLLGRGNDGAISDRTVLDRIQQVLAIVRAFVRVEPGELNCVPGSNSDNWIIPN